MASHPRGTRDLAVVSNDAGDCFEIFASDAPPLMQPHHLAFGVDGAEFDTLAERIRAAGATLEEPFEIPYGDRIVFFTDPAGNAVQTVGQRTAPTIEKSRHPKVAAERKRCG
ncbi:MAG: VOC family protein [Thermomicrobiales bacterium]